MNLGRVVIETADGPQARIVAASDRQPERWVDVRAAERLSLLREGCGEAAAVRLAAALVPGSLSQALGAGERFREAVARACEEADERAQVPANARVVAPIDPVAYRDFMAFEQHFVTAGRLTRGTDPPPVLYELPVSYFGNVHAILGPGDEIPWPHYSDYVDYELEVGIVIGRPGRNLDPDRALEHVLGLTVFNDFSARDIQRREVSGGLGPSKGKHFASAVGPRIVTLDALDESLRMTAKVNGELWSEGESGTLMWSIAELVAFASAAEPLAAGTLLGSGTVGGGCAMELGRRLSPGDLVELEIEGIGVLANRLSEKPPAGWMPEPRTPKLL